MRVKRRRVLKAIHELRSLAHIIDMHQLTKDPNVLIGQGTPTANSPVRPLTHYQLARYLGAMKLVTIADAKANLSTLIEAAENGQQVLIMRGSRPAVTLILAILCAAAGLVATMR